MTSDCKERNFQKTFKGKNKNKLKCLLAAAAVEAARRGSKSANQSKKCFPSSSVWKQEWILREFSHFPLLYRQNKEDPLSCYLAHPRKKFLRKRRFFLFYFIASKLGPPVYLSHKVQQWWRGSTMKVKPTVKQPNRHTNVYEQEVLHSTQQPISIRLPQRSQNNKKREGILESVRWSHGRVFDY